MDDDYSRTSQENCQIGSGGGAVMGRPDGEAFDPEDARCVGARVRQLRLHLGHNQTEFATRVGVSQSFLSDVESGKSEINRSLILAMGAVFGVRPEWLERGRGAMLSRALPTVPWQFGLGGDAEAVSLISLPGLASGRDVRATTYKGPGGLGLLMAGDILVYRSSDDSSVSPGSRVVCFDSHGEIKVCFAGRGKEGELTLLLSGDEAPVPAKATGHTVAGILLQVVRVCDFA